MKVEYKEILKDSTRLLGCKGKNVILLCEPSSSYLKYIALHSSEFTVIKDKRPVYRRPLKVEAYKIFSEIDLKYSKYVEIMTDRLNSEDELDTISIIYSPEFTERMYNSLKDVMQKGLEKNLFTLIVTDNICISINKLDMEIQLCKKWKA